MKARAVSPLTSIWAAEDRGAHELAFRHDSASDHLRRVGAAPEDGAPPPTLPACHSFMQQLAAGKARLFEDVRAETIAFYERECSA